MTAIVQYQIGGYRGTVAVTCDRDDDNENIIARAKAFLKRKAGPFPAGLYYEYYRVIKRDGDDIERAWFE